jgi:uncharacterized protein (TIGR03435 family)
MNTVLAILNAVVNSLWQALAVTALVWLALKFSARMNAATRHAIWWATLGVVLVLPVAPQLIQMIQRHPQPAVVATVKAPQAKPSAVATEPFIVTVAPGRTARWPLAILVIWAAILLWRMFQIVRSYFYLRGVRRRASVSPVPLPAIPRRVDSLISPDIVSPMAVGFLRPAIVLPESLVAELSDAERDHVLLHESAHLAKYDDWSNLAMRIMGGVLALHPIAVWILRRIEREREMACDDWVVSRTGSARPYAAGLARLIELRQAGRGEMLASGIFGGKSRIGDRIESLLRRGRTFSSRASAAGVAASTIALGALLFAGSFVPRWIAFAQQQPRPTFEVASIRLNPGCEGDRQDERFSPGSVSVTCITLRNLIQAAYGRFANGPDSDPQQLRFVGAPEWIGSSRYDITAKARSSVPMDQMFGPMLQVLLEDRFHLRVHRGTRDLPVYTMTVAKSGLKIRASKEGNCIPLDLNHAGQPSPKFCGRMTGRADGARITDDAYGMSMAEIAGRFLSNRLDRPVIDKTGLKGLFDAHLEFVRDYAPRDPGTPETLADTAGPSIFTAVPQQLGLKLSPAKGSVEVLVIDHVEKLDAN